MKLHLAGLVNYLGLKFATPIFDGAKIEDVDEWLEKAGLETGSKTDLV